MDLANEVAAPPPANAQLGKILTFDRSETGLSRSFVLETLDPSTDILAGFTFSDGEPTPNADPNNDCIVNAIDLGIFNGVFFSTDADADADADLTGDGIVDALDLGIFKRLFFAEPGPSGLQYPCI